MPSFSRRDLLKYGTIATGSLILPAVYGSRAIAGSISPRVRPFTLPFRVTPVLAPKKRSGNRDYYEITMRKTRVEILPGYQTEVWAYNGLVPGPTIYQTAGRESIIRFINQLGNIDTSVHLHGMAALPQYDGYANDVSRPGYYKDYYYPNNRAASLWYHDHAVHHTARNTFMGLAGIYIVQNQTELNLPLPKGKYDVPLCLQDKLFFSNGQLNYDNQGTKGVNGDVILVNGVPWPVMQVERRKYRFRLLNGSAARSYRIFLSNGDPMTIIGTDAGLVQTPVEVRNFRIGMAERYEFVIDFAKYPIGTQIVLRNNNPSNNDEFDNTHLIMRFDVTANATDTSNNTIPSYLREVRVFTPQEIRNARVREWRFERNNGLWRINGRSWNPNRVEANPGLGDIEVWRLYNNGGGWFHPVHVHLVDLQVLSRNGQAPFAYERGWKDVFYVGENEDVRVITQFLPHRGKYMMHCHNVDHEDFDMMIQWEVGQGGPNPLGAPPQPWNPSIPTPI
ncbi:MAG: multicopper oxidase domain-containing protein [Synechococcales bacterium]|nr:multicopper oxidase domain-containing protein [Synechococcales bacterium]